MARDVVYWDSAAFLALLNGDNPEQAKKCEDVYVAAQRGQIMLVTSTLTSAEVIYMKGTPRMDPAKRPQITAFFKAPYIVQKPVTRAIAELARDVVWDCNIKPKDAVHVATAAYYKIPVLHTFDRPNLINRGSVAVNGFTLTIIEPHAPRQLEIQVEPEKP